MKKLINKFSPGKLEELSIWDSQIYLNFKYQYQ